MNERLALDRALDQTPLAVAYHGTRNEALQSIRDNGLLAHPFKHYHPSRFYSGERGNSVYLAESPETATSWALSEVDRPEDATILLVEVPASGLHPDEEAAAGAERYTGDIPSEWIKAAYPVLPNGQLGKPMAFHYTERAADARNVKRFAVVQHKRQAHDAVIAMDRAIADRDVLAFDRGSVRSMDANNNLHVDTSNISKATINPYYGREIPDYEKLGLDPSRRYMLLRHPDELAKAAGSFNNLPVLSEHVPISAAAHRPDLVIGSTGTDAAYEHPYLRNSLVFWTKPAIDAIEDDKQKELSCAYRYVADMTPGVYEGQRYDGVMRNIKGNHVALVKEGRAGSDVVVGDSKEGMMPKITPAGLVAKSALFTYLGPRLAADQAIDLNPIALLAGKSSDFKDKRDAIIKAVTDATKDKLAADADIGDLANLLDALSGEKLDDMADIPPGQRTDDAEPDDTVAKIKEFLEGHNVDPGIIEQLDAFLAEANEPPDNGGAPPPPAEDETPEEKEAREKKEAEDKAAADKRGARDNGGANEVPKNLVTKEAMDKAIAESVKVAQDAAIKNQREIRDAERFVRAWVGDLAMDANCADDVYQTALTALNVKDVDKIHPSAYRTILEYQPKPGANRRPTLATDAKPASQSFAERFPDAARVRAQ